MDIRAIVRAVPEYKAFPTVAEMSRESRDLVRRYPKLARLETLGTSLEGRPIELLTIGKGKYQALLVGTPHPNEPIGTLTLDFLSRRLCEDEELRRSLDYTFLIVKCADPDGVALNEGWFKEPFSFLNYAVNYYRPPHREQVEWSFPVHYKTLHFSDPCPEARALMQVMDTCKPQFLYSLHNAGFCGVYFYLSELLPSLGVKLREIVAAQGLPLHRGEPEVPYVRELEPGILPLFGVREHYDYLARNLGEDPAPYIESGTSSDDFLSNLTASFCMVCELPYWFDPVLEDTSPSGLTRRQAVLQGIFRMEGVHQEVHQAFDAVRGGAPRNRIFRSVEDYVTKTPKRLAALKREVEDAAYDVIATKAEAFDATVARVLYHVLYLGEVYRLAVLRQAEALAQALYRRVGDLCGEIERRSHVRTVELRRLVAVQAASGLLALSLWQKRLEREESCGRGGDAI